LNIQIYNRVLGCASSKSLTLIKGFRVIVVHSCLILAHLFSTPIRIQLLQKNMLLNGIFLT